MAMDDTVAPSVARRRSSAASTASTASTVSVSIDSRVEENRVKPMELDTALEQLGYWGRFQLINYALLCFPIVFHSAFYLTYVFTAMEVEHRCLIPECEDPLSTELHPAWLRGAVPYTESDRPEGCLRYAGASGASPPANGSCPADLFSAEEVACTAWVYPVRGASIMSEWDMTCVDSHWKLSLVGTINNVGRFFGMAVAGFISDRFGRRTLLLIGLAFAGLVGMLHSFATSYVFFLVCELLDPIFNAGLYSAAFILGMELMGPQNRALWSALTHAVYGMGEALLGVLAWALQDWRWLLRALYGPAILSLALLWMLPESVRWLCSKGREQEARAIIRRAAVTNNMCTNQLDLEDLRASVAEAAKATSAGMDDEEEKPSTLWALRETFKSRVLRMRLLVCSFCWMTNTFVYYGLSLNSVAISGNQYLNFVLVCLIEVPAGLATWQLMDRIGRRSSMCSSLVLTGLSCVAFLFIPDTQNLMWVRTTIYMVGKFGITISYTVLYVLTAELFPTSVRHSLFALCSMVGRVGSAVAPQTPLLGHVMASLPVILFGSMSLVNGLLALVFPETHNTSLPDTVEEAENIGKGGYRGRGGRGQGPTANGDLVLTLDKEGTTVVTVRRPSLAARTSTMPASGWSTQRTSVCSLGSVPGSFNAIEHDMVSVRL